MASTPTRRQRRICDRKGHPFEATKVINDQLYCLACKRWCSTPPEPDEEE